MMMKGFMVSTLLLTLCFCIVTGTQLYESEELLVWLAKDNFGYKIFENALKNESVDVSESASQCLTQVREVVRAAEAKELWALKFFDAWGSFPSGLLYGHFVEFGSFDQCLSIGGASAIKGKYCLTNIPFSNLVNDFMFMRGLQIRIGTCLPASCSAKDLDTWLKSYLTAMFETENINVTLVNESTCQEVKGEPYTPLDWFAVAVLICLGLLLAAGTICDYLAQHRNCTFITSIHPLLAAFSLRINIRQLFHVTHGKQAPHIIPCLHGIRCLSIIWIIFGHGYMMLLLSPVINALEIVEWAQTPFSMFLQSGTIAVDTFFFLSGLLLVMVALRQLNKTNGKLNIPVMYLHRYLRLTPVLALAVLIFVTLYRHSGDGPIWTEFTRSYKLCDKTWWATLLYIQNYAAAGKMCLGHSWYLAVDMQLFIISPLLLISLWRWGKKAVAFIVVLTLVLLAIIFTIVMVHHLEVFKPQGNLGEDSPEMRQIYYSTHARATPWLIGLLFGYYLHCRAGKKAHLSKAVVCGAWLLSLATIFAALFAVYPKTQPGATPISDLSGAFYLTFSRMGWPLALCWVVFACIHGYAEPANTFLSWPFWQPISKLSYCLYIWHLLVEMVNIGRTKTNTHFSNYDGTQFFWSSFGMTLLLSIVIYLAIEAPMVGIEKFLFSKKEKELKETTTPTISTINTAATSISQQNLINGE